MLQILSASLRLSALRLSSSPPVYRPRFYSESSSESTSPVAGLCALSKSISSPSHIGLDSSSVIPVASSSVGLGAPNYTIAILSDKPDLRKLQDRLFSSSLRAIQSLPQLKHSSSEVKRAFLICAGPHGADMHCTARVFQGNYKGSRKYIGGIHFFLDNSGIPTFRRNRNNPKWTLRTFESQQKMNRVTILYDAPSDEGSNSESSK